MNKNFYKYKKYKEKYLSLIQNGEPNICYPINYLETTFNYKSQQLLIMQLYKCIYNKIKLLDEILEVDDVSYLKKIYINSNISKDIQLLYLEVTKDTINCMDLYQSKIKCNNFYVINESKYIKIYFRGSQYIKEFLYNFKFTHSLYNEKYPFIHYKMLIVTLQLLFIHGLYDIIISSYDQNKIIILFGFSLGAAYAAYIILIIKYILNYNDMNIYAICVGIPPIIPIKLNDYLSPYILCIAHDLDPICRLNINLNMTLPKNIITSNYQDNQNILEKTNNDAYIKKNKFVYYRGIIHNFPYHIASLDLIYQLKNDKELLLSFPLKKFE